MDIFDLNPEIKRELYNRTDRKIPSRPTSVNYRKISIAQPEKFSLESRDDGDDIGCRDEEFSLPAGEDQWVTFNVGGTSFLTRRSTLLSVPNTLLADLDEDSKHYHAQTGQYLFDRNPLIFQYILDFYRTGQLHFPNGFCGPTIKKELMFWGLDENLIQPCCWNSYQDFYEQEETLNTLGTAFNVIDRFDTDHKKSNILLNQVHIWRARIWYFLEDPTSSFLAQLWAIFYVLLILTSVLTLAFDSHGDFRVPSPVNRSRDPNEDNPKKILMDTTNPHPAMYITELVVSSIFATDLILRLLVCPSKIRFLKSYLNWLDITVVVSQWTTSTIAFLPNFWEDPNLQLAYQIFSQLRLCRVFLIFKLARHYLGLRILLLALKASFKEIMLLTMFMLIGMVIFGTLIYYAEFDHPSQFLTIPTTFWWSIVTMTTVGYGDVHPKTPPGYVVGAICALAGMLATGLPIPIIANNFTLYHSVSRLKQRLETRDSNVKLSSEILGGVKSIFKGVHDVAASAGNRVISIGSRAKQAITSDKEEDSASKELQKEDEEGHTDPPLDTNIEKGDGQTSKTASSSHDSSC